MSTFALRPLILDEKARAKISKVKDYADENRFPRRRMQAVVDGEEEACGFNINHSCILEKGYRAVYSIEEHPAGWCHHLSISVEDKEKLPNVNAVEALMKEFGFVEESVNDCSKVWLEEVPNHPTAVNVVCLLPEKEDGSQQVDG